MARAFKHLTILIGVFCLATVLCWLLSPASLATILIRDLVLVKGLSFTSCRTLTNDKLELNECKLELEEMGHLQVKKVTLNLLPLALLAGKSPIDEVVAQGPGSFRSHKREKKNNDKTTLELPFNNLRILSPGISLSSQPKFTITTAEVKSSSNGLISVSGSLSTTARNQGSFNGIFDLHQEKLDLSLAMEKLPCSPIASQVTTTPISGLCTLRGKIEGEKRGTNWCFHPKGEIKIEDLAIGVWLKDGNVVGDFSSQSVNIKEASAEINLPHLGSAKSTAAFMLTSQTFLIQKSVLAMEGGGNIESTGRVALSTASDPFTALKSIMEAESLPYQFDVTFDELPLLPLNILSNKSYEVKKGHIKGRVSLTGLYQSSSPKMPKISGHLEVASLNLQSSLFGLKELSSSLKLENSNLQANLNSGQILMQGLPKMTVGGKFYLSTEELDLREIRLEGSRGFSIVGLGKIARPYEFSIDSLTLLRLQVKNLPVGPNRIIAPKLFGQPIAGRGQIEVDLSHSAKSPLLNSNGLIQIVFAGHSSSHFPIKANFLVNQTKNQAQAKMTIKKEDVSLLSCVADFAKQSKAALQLTSFPLTDLGLPIKSISLSAISTWPGKETLPLKAFVSNLPNELSLCLNSFSGKNENDHTVVSLARQSSLTVNVPSRKVEGNIVLNCLDNETVWSLSTKGKKLALALSCQQLDLAKLWKSLYPNILFDKPFGFVNLNLKDVNPLEGVIELNDGGMEHWQKLEGIIRCLKIHLPKLQFSLSGPLSRPFLKSEALSFALSKEKPDFTCNNLCLKWNEKAVLEGKTIRQGEIRLSGQMKDVLGKLSLLGWSKRSLTNNNVTRLDFNGSIERINKSEESIVLDIKDDIGGKGLLEATCVQDRLNAKLKANNLSVGHLPGLASLDKVTIDVESALKMQVPGGILEQAKTMMDGGVPVLLELLRKNGHLVLNKLHLKCPELNIEIDKPFKAIFSGTGVELQNLEATVASHRISAHGSFDPFGQCSLKVQSESVPLKTLSTLIGLRALDLSGSMSASMELNGQMPIPDLEGSLKVDKGRLKVPYVDEDLFLPTLSLSSQGPLTVVSATGLTWGGTPLRFTGSQEKGITKLQLTGSGLNCTFGKNRIPAIELASVATITPTSTPVFRLSLESKRGTTFHLPSSIPSSENSKSIDLNKLLKMLKNIDGQLELRLPPRFRIVNKFIDAEVSGHGIVKTQPNVSASFSVTVRSGEVSLHRRTFRLQSGQLTATYNQQNIHTALTLKAKTTINDYVIELNVVGPVNDPKVTLTSMPPLNEEDVIGLLTLGMVPLAGETANKDEIAATARDYLITSALSNYLFSTLKLRELTLKNSEEGAFVRMRKYVGRLRLDVERSIHEQNSDYNTAYSFEFGVTKNLYLEGKKRTSDKETSDDTYLGFFKTFRFR